MSETDNPLKLLITQFADAFAAWLLPQPIKWIRPLNVEFPAPPATDYRELQHRLESLHQPDQLQQVLLALFDAQNTAVILDLLHNLTNTPRHGGNGGL